MDSATTSGASRYGSGPRGLARKPRLGPRAIEHGCAERAIPISAFIGLVYIMLASSTLRGELPLQLALAGGLLGQTPRIYFDFGESALKCA